MGGGDPPLTRLPCVQGDNVTAFVDLYVQHVLFKFSERAIMAFLHGFHSLMYQRPHSALLPTHYAPPPRPLNHAIPQSRPLLVHFPSPSPPT